AKKMVEEGIKCEDGEEFNKGSEMYKATVVGDTVGDPLKDTSGPSLNILVKLMSIVALVIAPSIAVPDKDTSDKANEDESKIILKEQIQNNQKLSQNVADFNAFQNSIK
ncbi:MAG: hypothetical protein DRI94_10740, partial [Bacteroidetes bacterium]